MNKFFERKFTSPTFFIVLIDATNNKLYTGDTGVYLVPAQLYHLLQDTYKLH
jgi:hypothetical protein